MANLCVEFCHGRILDQWNIWTEIDRSVILVEYIDHSV